MRSGKSISKSTYRITCRVRRDPLKALNLDPCFHWGRFKPFKITQLNCQHIFEAAALSGGHSDTCQEPGDDWGLWCCLQLFSLFYFFDPRQHHGSVHPNAAGHIYLTWPKYICIQVCTSPVTCEPLAHKEHVHNILMEIQSAWLTQALPHKKAKKRWARPMNSGKKYKGLAPNSVEKATTQGGLEGNLCFRLTAAPVSDQAV